MAELANCSRCGKVFAKTIRDLCHDCYKEEERNFEKVYSFLRQRKNRTATLHEIVDATGIEEDLIIKFIKEKRLRVSQFPNLAYPCARCGTYIVQGTICAACSHELKSELEKQEELEKQLAERYEKERQHENVYYTINKQ